MLGDTDKTNRTLLRKQFTQIMNDNNESRPAYMVILELIGDVDKMLADDGQLQEDLVAAIRSTWIIEGTPDFTGFGPDTEGADEMPSKYEDDPEVGNELSKPYTA